MENETVLGLFQELGPATVALDRLRALNLPEEAVEVLSGQPYSPEMLGRPRPRSRLGTISLIAVGVGLLVGVFYTMVTPHLYTIEVGGQAVIPGPPTAVLMYEFVMILLILGTFLGMLWLNDLPNYRPQPYSPKLSDGQIGVLLHCPPEQAATARAVLEELGAEIVTEEEWRAA